MSVARDFSVYSAVNIASLVLLLGTSLILRRYLGPVLAGVWVTLELLPNYAQYAPLGILDSAGRDLPYLLGTQRTGEFERRKHTLFWLTHGIGAGLTAAVLLGALIFHSRISPAPLLVGLLVYAPILWLQILAAYYVVLYRARKRFVTLSARQGITNLTKALLTMAGGYLYGLYGVFAALLTASVVQAVLLHSGLEERFERRFDRRVLWPMLVAGLPMLIGAVAFETIRNAGGIVLPYTSGFEAAGIYSVVTIVCQGLLYLPNTLALVMFPRFQERYGETQTVASLRRFVEVPLHVLGDTLLAAIVVLLVALPPVIEAYFPEFAGSVAPLRVLLVGTYFLCLSPPAGQLLLTIHKQAQVLFIAVPAMVLALVAAYAGVSYGLIGVAAGVSVAAFAHFLGINLYAFAQLGGLGRAAAPVAGVCAQALVVLAAAWAIERFVPAGPRPLAMVGGWRLVAAIALSVPLLTRAGARMRALSAAPSDPSVSIDNGPTRH